MKIGPQIACQKKGDTTPWGCCMQRCTVRCVDIAHIRYFSSLSFGLIDRLSRECQIFAPSLCYSFFTVPGS
ncbi:11376_t:CDS:1, partial [Dentiscutata heterogama]